MESIAIKTLGTIAASLARNGRCSISGSFVKVNLDYLFLTPAEYAALLACMPSIPAHLRYVLADVENSKSN